MLLKTYQKIIELFQANHGYLSFAMLQARGISPLQISELEYSGELQKFTRGWYWCRSCGWEKPKDYKYVEIGKANPRAVICMDSACYLNGIIRQEPEKIAVATDRTDRKKMELDFPIRRFYFQNAGIPGEIRVKDTEFGSYRFYSPERTYCDCFRMQDKLSPELLAEITAQYHKQQLKSRVMEYAKELRAIRNVERVDEMSL